MVNTARIAKTIDEIKVLIGYNANLIYANYIATENKTIIRNIGIYTASTNEIQGVVKGNRIIFLKQTDPALNGVYKITNIEGTAITMERFNMFPTAESLKNSVVLINNQYLKVKEDTLGGFLTESFINLDDALDSLNEKTKQQQVDIDALKTSSNTLTTKVNTVEANTNNNTTKITALETKTEGINTNLGTVQTTANTALTNSNTNATSIASIEESILNIKRKQSNNYFRIFLNNTTTVTGLGIALTTNPAFLAVVLQATKPANLLWQENRVRVQTALPTTAEILATIRSSNGIAYFSNGIFLKTTFAMADPALEGQPANVEQARFFCGLTSASFLLRDQDKDEALSHDREVEYQRELDEFFEQQSRNVEPSTLKGVLGVYEDRAETALKFIACSQTGTPLIVDLGEVGVYTVSNNIITLVIKKVATDSFATVTIRNKNATTGVELSKTIVVQEANLITQDQLLFFNMYRSTGLPTVTPLRQVAIDLLVLEGVKQLTNDIGEQ